MSASTIIRTLWAATDDKALSDEQLSALSCDEALNGELNNVAEIMSGIGCLIAHDGDGKLAAGSFQDRYSVSQLLWVFSDVIKTQADASFVAIEAESVLRKRRLERASRQTAATA